MLSLLALAAAATLAIWNRDPFVEWTYEGGIFMLAGWMVIRPELRFAPTLFGPVPVIAALLAVWRFAQTGGRSNRLPLRDVERFVADRGFRGHRSGGL